MEEHTDIIVVNANGVLKLDEKLAERGGEIVEDNAKYILEERGGMPILCGESILVSPGELGSKYLIHTVPPVWWDGEHNEI